MNEIDSHASNDAETEQVLLRMAEFTHLQRLFRAVLDGQVVLTGMDLGGLTKLASETAGTVNRAETLDWLPLFRLEASMVALESLVETPAELLELGSQIAEKRLSLGLDKQEALYRTLEDSGCPAPRTSRSFIDEVLEGEDEDIVRA